VPSPAAWEHEDVSSRGTAKISPKPAAGARREPARSARGANARTLTPAPWAIQSLSGAVSAGSLVESAVRRAGSTWGPQGRVGSVPRSSPLSTRARVEGCGRSAARPATRGRLAGLRVSGLPWPYPFVAYEEARSYEVSPVHDPTRVASRIGSGRRAGGVGITARSGAGRRPCATPTGRKKGARQHENRGPHGRRPCLALCSIRPQPSTAKLTNRELPLLATSKRVTS
jgi:hypothetical protein